MFKSHSQDICNKIIDVPIVDQPPETPDTIEYTYNALYIYKLERQELNDESSDVYQIESGAQPSGIIGTHRDIHEYKCQGLCIQSEPEPEPELNHRTSYPVNCNCDNFSIKNKWLEFNQVPIE